MIWEVEIHPNLKDTERERVCDEFDLLTHSERGGDLVKASSRGFLLEGEITRQAVERFCHDLLVDPVVENVRVSEVGTPPDGHCYTVLLQPGVMDPVSQSVLQAGSDLGISLQAVRTFRRYYGPADVTEVDVDVLSHKILANDAIEQVVVGPIEASHLALGGQYAFQPISVPLRSLDDAGLVELSKSGQLALNLDEMKTIQAYFAQQDRDPTDIELESIAQTWSEHCSHKTLRGSITYTETIHGQPKTRNIKNLLKETIFGATQELRQRWGDRDWCVSVFSDNAGVVQFLDDLHVCFKVETHNHPSAIEPYGGANTGIGGVVRDPMGTGLGAKPICNTDVFCFAPPDYPPQDLPPGTLHPRRTMMGVVAGVRDYGNRMGIPTVNGAVLFDERYLANPLVYCGTVGVIPADRMHKAAQVGDYIVAVGGRTGRDGIHGATFSSLELTAESDSVSGGAVQIGNAITEKMVLDVILKARDLNLYHAITDCGAGGFSSAVGEMGADLGARVDLDQAPLKYSGLSYTEIWISESQERMVLAVPPKNWDALRYLCAEEGVEATVIGVFEDTKHLRLYYQQQLVGDIDMDFLHDGRPDVVRSATWKESQQVPFDETLPHSHIEILKKALADYSTCSKEWIIRQYDHEVQGGSVVKPLTGVKNDGPSDAAVVMPQLGNWKGLAVGNGINPWYGDLDPYWMAAAVIDEAIRNVVAVGADPSRIAILDNFCWGNTNDPVILGSLVRAAIACKEVALAYNTPFISGKDSLMNEYQSADRRISIPGTLLISSLGQVADVRKCVTMDAKAPGNLIYQIGETHDHLGASLLSRVLNKTGGLVPQVDLSLAPTLYQAVHRAISSGLIRSCHDLSEGGLAVALAEMAFAGGVGIDIDQLQAIEPNMSDVVLLYSETPSRFVVEVEPGQQQQFETVFTGLPYTLIGKTTKEARLRIADHRGEWLLWATLSELKENWQAPLRW